jgi:plastocyanin
MKRVLPFAVLAIVSAFAWGTAGAAAATYRGVASQPSVVWITGPGAAPVPNPTIHQTMKSFVPAVLVVPAGTAVTFPNDDNFYHSVYSVSPSNPFDIGLYDTGPGKSVLFQNPGVVEVRCHVHGSMHATIVVVDGPYVMTTHPSEEYQLTIAPGAHVLHVWTDGSPVATSNIVVK